MSHVLIVDDDTSFTSALAEYIRQEGFEVRVASSLEQARLQLATLPPDVALIDLLLPDGGGLELLDDLERSQAEAVVITGHPSVDSAVEGIRKDVADYLTKPLDMNRLRSCLERLKPSVGTPSKAASGKSTTESNRFGHFIGCSTPMLEVYKMIEQVAPTNATVMVYGESGIGKELAAQTIHELSGRSGPFLALNCGAIPESLIGNELFGHERGSFTGASQQHKGYFERTSGGTLFLDEITEMPLDMQVILLRVLETGCVMRFGGNKEIEVDVRLIAASNRDPRQAVADERLREDLYFRLMVFPVRLPPLRERKEDIPALARYFIDALNEEQDGNKWLTQEALNFLAQQRWPGNVRELKNALHRAYIISEEEEISVQNVTGLLDLTSDRAQDASNTLSELSLEEAERSLILATLDRHDDNKRAAAEALGVSLKTLYNKLKRYQTGS
jgi:two-component system response regulator AtoC